MSFSRWKALFRRARLERDLDDELRFHLEMREDSLRAAGMPANEARAAAQRRFGNAAALAEECREVWSFLRLETLWQDARFAGRVLRKSPGFTTVAALSLALGIGANAAIFSLVNAILLRPLPYPDADRLLRLTGSYPKGAVVALQELSRTMEVAGASDETEFNLAGRGDAVRLAGCTASANFFSVLRRGAAIGRTFQPGDDRPGRDRVVVLGHALWRSRFGGDPNAVGRTIALDGVARQVVGVMPVDFHFPSPAVELWVPLRLDPSQRDDYWGFGWMPVVARLRPPAGLPQARDELHSLIPRVAARFPWPAANWNAAAVVVPLQQDLVRDVSKKLLVLQAAVALVLMIACANLASLLLARGAARTKELALRAALGAGRGRILRQLLTESLALALVGAASGTALAELALRGLVRALPADARGFADVAIDGNVLAFVTLLAVLSCLAFGIAPAASASAVDLSATMKRGGPRAAAPAGTRLRGAFIATEVALAAVLTIGAGLLVRTLANLGQVDAGFEPARTVAARVTPDPATCLERDACVAFYDALLRRLRERSGILEVAAASALPLSGAEPLLPVELEGHALVPGQTDVPLLWAGAVTSDYFRVLRIPLLNGRAFTDFDGERTAPVVLVSAGTARRYWPGDDPIGKRIRVTWDKQWRTVVGVVGDVRQYALDGRTPDEISGALYLPYPQSVALNRQIPAAMTLLARVSGDPNEAIDGIRQLVASVNPDVPVSDARSLDAVMAASVREPRTMMWFFAAFAGCALLLAAIGTYGVVSYSIAQRRYEIGVRMALGATRGDILGLVVGQSMRLVFAGLGAGLVAGLGLARTLSSFLYQVTPTDPRTFATVAALLLSTAFVAAYIPGRRAAKTDPVHALKVD